MSVKKRIKPVENPVKETPICVYLGPSIRGIIQKGQIFSGTKEEVLASLVPAAADYPGIAGLLVTGEELPTARTQVRTAGTLLYTRYQKLAKGQK